MINITVPLMTNLRNMSKFSLFHVSSNGILHITRKGKELVMKKKKGNLLFTSKAKSLQLEMDQYFKFIDEGAMLLEEGLSKYLDGNMELFEEKIKEIARVEHEADNLRRQITQRLCVEMLIPDSRGDVLGLLETLDNVLDSTKHVAISISIEKPDIKDFLKDDFRELVRTTVLTVHELTLAVRAFFRQSFRVSEHLDKVHFWESENDKIEERIKRKAFECEEITQFSKRVHMRYFAERISKIADEAEEVGENLAVYNIKRSM